MVLSLPPGRLHLKTPFPLGYENLSEFDIIPPAENRFPGRGRGLSKVYSCEYSGGKIKKHQARFSEKIAPSFWMIRRVGKI
jgi:hypothetical protein